MSQYIRRFFSPPFSFRVAWTLCAIACCIVASPLALADNKGPDRYWTANPKSFFVRLMYESYRENLKTEGATPTDEDSQVTANTRGGIEVSYGFSSYFSFGLSYFSGSGIFQTSAATPPLPPTTTEYQTSGPYDLTGFIRGDLASLFYEIGYSNSPEPYKKDDTALTMNNATGRPSAHLTLGFESGSFLNEFTFTGRFIGKTFEGVQISGGDSVKVLFLQEPTGWYFGYGGGGEAFAKVVYDDGSYDEARNEGIAMVYVPIHVGNEIFKVSAESRFLLNKTLQDHKVLGASSTLLGLTIGF